MGAPRVPNYIKMTAKTYIDFWKAHMDPQFKKNSNASRKINFMFANNPMISANEDLNKEGKGSCLMKSSACSSSSKPTEYI